MLHIYRGSVKWKIEINIEKIQLIHFSFKRTHLAPLFVQYTLVERQSSMKCVGVRFDSDPTWGPHVDEIAR